MEFQPDRYGGRYTITLGFHYAFLPPLMRLRPCKVRELGTPDCLLDARIGFLLPHARDTWFDCGSDPDAVQQTLSENAQNCLQAFDRVAARRRHPGDLLDSILGGQLCAWSCQSVPALAGVAIRVHRAETARALLEQFGAEPWKPEQGLYNWLKQASADSMPDWFVPPSKEVLALSETLGKPMGSRVFPLSESALGISIQTRTRIGK